MGILCVVCNKMFSQHSNLNKHRRKVHGLEANSISYDKSVWSYKCLELNCNNSYRNSEFLIQHLRQEHDFVFVDPEEYIFDNKSEFENWKSHYETENTCNYTVARTCESTRGKVTYYYCNRTKSGKQCQQERTRSLKSKGSCKLQFACTSHLKLTHNENKLYVEFQTTHYGHSLDLEHLRISKADKDLIASKLIAGVTKNRIADAVKYKTDSWKRIDLLTSKDIDNIKRSYNIETSDGKRHSDDTISVELQIIVPSQTKNKQANDNIMNKVNQTFLKLQQCNFRDLDESTLSEINMHLNILSDLVDLPRNDFINDKSSNENSVPQLSFYSTQKKRKPQNIFNKKSNKKQKISINNFISEIPEEYISPDMNYDHIYSNT